MDFKAVSKNCKTEWYILRIFFLIIFAAATFITAVADFDSELSFVKIILLINLGIIDLFMLIYAFIFPTLQYDKYRYRICEDRIERKSGIIFLRHQIVPFVRMQHIVVYRGILDRIFNMSTVTVFTAGTCVRLRNLGIEQAEEVTENLKAILKQKEEKGEAGND